MAMSRTQVLYLGPPAEQSVLAELPIPRLLRRLGAEVTATHRPLKNPPPATDLAVSYRFRHKVPASVLDSLPVVNLHMAHLPWCRGAHPLFWAVADGVPVGGTLHWMDAGIDTGSLLAVKDIDCAPSTTLREAYARLEALMIGLLEANWQRAVRREPGTVQQGPCSLHRADELPELPSGWDTPLSWVRDWGLARREGHGIL